MSRLPIRPRAARGLPSRIGAFAIALAASAMPLAAAAADVIRIGLPVKAYWSTVTTDAATNLKLFQKEGITAEVTIFRSSGDAFEAMAAGSTDLILASPSQVAAGITRGVASKVVAGGANKPNGWYLLATAKSPVSKVQEMQGKSIGIAGAGSMTDLFARWAATQGNVEVKRIPVGSAGVVPNLIAGNVDTAVIMAPQSFQLITEKTAKPVVDFGTQMPEMLSEGWIATDKLIAEKPQLIQRALNALYGGLRYVQQNRAYGIKAIAEVHGISEPVAVKQYEDVVLKLLPNGEIRKEWVEAWLDLAKTGGMTGLAPAEATYTTRFKPVPTTP
ncbi:MAG TPA: ABC transporter substrate-binding protein [Ramlibacter sp.]|uniref:ABC transporter substrate-binding protein n=1 Tax=Ramlibacter sp. TaxID=1917967 RepID=UPI002C92708A|nr:ABC transporter substrate-binding protein [Ramlibacter sp.]HVZ45430.1 ABC transporter substrate-binding protein [Ramlibacter sp.]